MLRRSISPLTVLAALTVLVVGFSPAPAQEPSASSFLEQIDVRVINVDVVVLDKEGTRVTGLEREDFEILEDGKPVELTNFSAYTSESLSTGAGTATVPGNQESEVETTTPPAPPITWAFYFDQAKMDPGVRNAVLKQLATFGAHSVRPDDRALAATFDGISLKLLSQLGPAGETVAALTEAQKTLGTPAVQASRRHFIENQILSSDLNSRTANQDAQALLDEIDFIIEEEAVKTRNAMEAFGDLFAILSGIEGRIAVVLVSGGYETRPGEELFRRWQAKFGALGIANPNRQLNRHAEDATRDFSRLIGSAGRGRFTVYSIQAGQNRGPDVSAESLGIAGISTPVSGVDPTGLIEGSTVAAFSTATGGRTFNFGGDLAQRLEVAREDLDTYYSLGYRPTGDRDGENRKVEVKVRRAGLRALHRVAVSEASWRERTGDTAVTALLADGIPDSVFGAEIEVGTPTEKKGFGKSRLVPVTVNVPLRGVTLLPGEASHRGKLYFQFAVRDPDGGYRRLESRPLDFEVPNEKLAAALGQHVAYRIELKLEPGSYRVAAAVLDELGGVTGVTTAPVVLAAK